MSTEKAVGPLRPLVGRKEEIRVAKRELEMAREGHTRVLFLEGEPGIGKTRLMAEVAHQAATQNFRVLRGGSTEAEGMPPYLPFLEALGSYIRTAEPALLRTQLGIYGSVLAELFPELVQKLDKLAHTYDLPSSQARLRLYEAVGNFIAVLAENQPLLFILDDLHWADRATLEMLSYILTHQAALRCMIVGAYRQDEKKANSVLEKVILELTRVRLLTTLWLGPLSEQEIGLLIRTPEAAANTYSFRDPAWSRLLFRHSEGNPFFAEELWQAWQDKSLLPPVRPEDREIQDFIQFPELPESLMVLIRQRLDRLSPETRNFLRTAAIIGRNFELALLAETSGQPVEAVEEYLEEARNAAIIGLIRAPEGYVFRHDKFREVLYEEVSPFRRKRLHGFIGRAIQQTAHLPPLSPSTSNSKTFNSLAALAYHFTNSGDAEQGTYYAELAGAQAFKTFAYETAQQHYQSALKLIFGDSQQPTLILKRGELNLGLGEAALLAGNEKEAVKAFEVARDLFLDLPDYPPLKLIQALYGAGRTQIRLENFPDAKASFEEALTLLYRVEYKNRTEELTALLIELEAELGNFLAVSLSRFEEGLAHTESALKLARQAGMARQEVIALRTSGNLLVRTGQSGAGFPLLKEAMEKARCLDSPAEGAECAASLFNCYMWAGQISLARQSLHERMEFALRCQEPYQLRHVYSLLGLLLFLTGNFEESEYWLGLAREVVQQLTDPEPLAFLQQSEAVIAFFRGDYEQGIALLEAALLVFRQMGPGMVIWYLAPLALFKLYHGKETEALKIVAEVEECIASLPPASLPVLDAAAILAEYFFRLPNREKLEQYYSLLLPAEGCFINFLVDRLLAEIELHLGKIEAAWLHLAKAMELAQTENFLIEISACLALEALLLLSNPGKEEAARQKASQALENARQYGMEGWANHLSLKLAQIFPPSPQASSIIPPAPDYTPSPKSKSPSDAFSGGTGTISSPRPGGLSHRELEVLRLVAQGMSNFEIAQTLSISEKTAGNHLTNIFTKTGLPNRVAAAAWAIRHNLA